MTSADIGLIGLAVMGQNLVLNMNDHGYTVAVFNRTLSKVDNFLDGTAKGTNVIGTHSMEEFIAKLKRPRRVMLMVKAGEPVDEFIEHLLPLLEAGDIIIDGGNSLFTDTMRRCKFLEEKGILYMGVGISGGEEGARHGPSMMPGGNPAAWPHVKEIFQAISAKADGEPCCDWVGDEGAGHYVKMVHNGIEYGDMQLICETYSLLREGVKLEPAELQNLFVEWNKGDLNSYLIEIAAKIFGTKDEDGTLLLDKVLDVAGQKGTGKWTVINSLDLGSPLTLISEAVFARCLSALKEQRARAYKAFSKPQREKVADKDKFITSLKQGLYAAKIISYAQGFMLMKQAASDYGWELNYGSVALMWRGGCIIRSQFLGRIKQAFDKNPELENLLLDEFFLSEITSREEGLRNSAANAIALAIAAPCLTSAISFYDAYRTDKSSANLIQAMRDFFGAHTYERVDQPRGQFFHTDWAGTGGKVSSGTYNV